jgi:peptide/nickel transport system substrate-binding protein
MRRAFGWLAVILIAALVAAGCGGDDDDGGGGDAGPSTTAAESGGDTTTTAAETVDYDRDATLKVIVQFISSRLDPHWTLNGIHQKLYDRILQVDQNKQLMPGVAESWETSTDGLTLTLKLRTDAKFNDGTPIDAAAVKANLDRARGNPQTLPFAAAAYKAISAVDAVDATTVKVTLSEPDATLPYQMAANYGTLINPKAIEAGTNLDQGDGGGAGAGSTGYHVVSFEPSKSLIIERADDAPAHWDETAFTPKRIEFTASADPQAQTSALSSGAVDIAYLSSKKEQAQQQLGGSFKIYDVQSDGGQVLILWPTGPLADQKVRTAIAQAIDFDALVESGALPIDVTPTTQLFAPDSPGYIEGLAPFEYDLDAAKAVLTEPISFEMAYPAGNAAQQLVAEYVKEQLAEVGVTVNLTAMPLADILSKGAAGELTSSVQTSAGTADPTAMMTVLYAANQKAAGPRAPEVLEDIAKINQMPLGSDERTEALEELNEKWLETATVIAFERDMQHFGYSEKAVGLEKTLNGYSGLVDMRHWGIRAS